MKKNKDPLRPKEDVRIEDKEHGFLETLKKAVKSKEPSKKDSNNEQE